MSGFDHLKTSSIILAIKLLLLLLLLLLLSMMMLIIGFTCPPTIHFKFITLIATAYFMTKCDRFVIAKYTKCYYEVRQV